MLVSFLIGQCRYNETSFHDKINIGCLQTFSRSYILIERIESFHGLLTISNERITISKSLQVLCRVTFIAYDSRVNYLHLYIYYAWFAYRMSRSRLFIKFFRLMRSKVFRRINSFQILMVFLPVWLRASL